MYKTVGILMALLLIGCDGSERSSKEYMTIEEVSENTIKVNGGFDDDTAKQLLEEMEKRPKLQKIIITSGGGDVSAAIDIAKKIHDRKIMVEVAEYCMSSCFNYLVLAASKVHIHPNSILGYHGTAKTSVPDLSDPIFLPILNKEKDFFEYIGRDEGVFLRIEKDIINEAKKHNVGQIDFWMVNRHEMMSNGMEVTSNSYFPISKLQLDELIEDISKNTGKEFLMNGEF